MEQDKTVNLDGANALEKIRAIVKKAKTCLFCSAIRTGVPMSVRPMLVLDVDDEGYLWFMTSDMAKTNDEIERDPFVHLLFQTGPWTEMMNLYGISEEVDDEKKRNALWDSSLETWFDGPQDPKIELIRVEVLEGYYWEDQRTAPVAVFKTLRSALTGDTDSGTEGQLTV